MKAGLHSRPMTAPERARPSQRYMGKSLADDDYAERPTTAWGDLSAPASECTRSPKAALL